MSTKSTRYGNLMILVNQDHSKSHIEILEINFMYRFLPSLLRSRDVRTNSSLQLSSAQTDELTRCFLQYQSMKYKRNGNLPIYRRLRFLPVIKMKKLATRLTWLFSKTSRRAKGLVAMIRA
ncbi:unnamed protein product [Albugo candida]|uniref:Uncharacterized protein n=1 Tax=Albugo candida TaxID=65357 RepID=A0A024FU72_9STRA|nr:unnamed protein product [Albugo candida]|eukprot:CCI10675.1 unnamed protein product [Albugo candida]